RAPRHRAPGGAGTLPHRRPLRRRRGTADRAGPPSRPRQRTRRGGGRDRRRTRPRRAGGAWFRQAPARSGAGSGRWRGTGPDDPHPGRAARQRGGAKGNARLPGETRRRMGDALMTRRVAIANRGEIAVRIAATCRLRGYEPVLLCGEPDADGFAARAIGRVEVVGPAGSEMDPDAVVAAARRAGAIFLHPGYGFLSERPALARACAAAGIRFLGPSPETLERCGDKVETRRAAVEAGVPVLSASEPLGDAPEEWCTAAKAIGYPV